MEEANLFENAKFGDRYLTRDGRKALFLSFGGNPVDFVRTYHEGFGLMINYLDGSVVKGKENVGDIVSRCFADGWEALPNDKQWLSLQINAMRNMLDSLPRPSQIMRTSLENRIADYEELLKEKQACP